MENMAPSSRPLLLPERLSHLASGAALTREAGHLRTSPFAGREIIVDERNRTEPIKILELLDDPPPKPKVGWRFQRSRKKGDLVNEAAAGVSPRQEMRRPPPPSGPRASALDGAATAAACQRAQEQGCAQGPSTLAGYPAGIVGHQISFGDAIPPMAYMSPQPYMASTELQDAAYVARTEPSLNANGWGMRYGPAYAAGYRCYEDQHAGLAPLGRAPPPAPVSGTPYTLHPVVAGTRRASCWDGMGMGAMSGSPGVATAVGAAPGPAATQADSSLRDDDYCKVHLVSLKHAATPRDVEQWVRSRMGDWARTVVGVDVPMDPQKGRIRGSACVTLSSAAAAGRAVEALQRRLFMGRLVYARPAGDVDRGGGGGIRGPAVKPRGPECGPPSPSSSGHRHSPPRAKDGSSAGAGEAKYAPPVIAHGTNYKPPR